MNNLFLSEKLIRIYFNIFQIYLEIALIFLFSVFSRTNIMMMMRILVVTMLVVVLCLAIANGYGGKKISVIQFYIGVYASKVVRNTISLTNMLLFYR